MAYLQTILGYRDFYKSGEIINKLAQVYSELYAEEDFNNAESLLFFQTKKQQTWLIITNLALYCILDDTQSKDLEVRWRMAKSDFLNSVPNSKAPKRNYYSLIDIDPTYKENNGLVHFTDKHKNWLYSKALYPDYNIFSRDFKGLISKKWDIDFNDLVSHGLAAG